MGPASWLTSFKPDLPQALLRARKLDTRRVPGSGSYLIAGVTLDANYIMGRAVTYSYH